MNQNYTSNGLNNPTYIPNQSTYPPYMNIPGYSNLNSNNNTTNTQIDPQYAENLFSENLESLKRKRILFIFLILILLSGVTVYLQVLF